jgi:dipeptidyl aminopeptidase/acylaminoacyl peptidase
MTEYTTLFEQASARFDVPDLPFEGVLRRRDRKRRNQRIAAGAVGLAIAIAIMALGSVVLRSAREPQPADWPVPSRTTVPLFHKGEVLTRPLDRQTLVATDIATGETRTLAQCRSDCVAFVGSASSADRTWLAYDVMTCGGACDPIEPEQGLWVVGAEGSLRHFGSPENWRWSPTAPQLAAVEVGRSGSELFLLDPASGERTRIATTDRYITAIVWGPDGRSIAYAAQPGNGLEGAPVGDHDPTGVFVIRSGGEPHRVSAVLGPSGIAWSPDGTSLLLDSNDGVRSQVAIVSADGSDERVLVEGPAFERPGEPVWSPDSRRIAYLRTPKGGREANALEFWVIGADGRGRVRLGRFGTWEKWGGPVWSPDSRLIAFGRILHSADAISWFVAPADGSAVAEPIDTLEVERWKQV